ncbi:MAG: hypothetical protein NZ938_07650 [Aigarchaeota archaeon]|nr:hypothetical protein [Candidatus Calditenuaceae archaeon]
MSVELEVCGPSTCGVESYLFVGSGEEKILIRDRGELKRQLAARELSDGLIQSIAKELVSEGESFQRARDPETQMVVPVIFGSSVKGNIKSRLQLTLRPSQGTAVTCIFPYRPLKGAPPVGTHGWRHFRIWQNSLAYTREGVCNATNSPEVCVVCDLLGAPGLSSLVSFGTFYGRGVSTTELSEGAVRLVAATPGSRFTGSISFRGLKLSEVGLLLIGMGYTLKGGKIDKMPVLFGSHKYRGLGGKVMGRVVYNVRDISTSSRCRGEYDVNPGRKYDGGGLDDVLTKALNRAYEEYGQYIEQIDESRAAEEVMRHV